MRSDVEKIVKTHRAHFANRILPYPRAGVLSDMERIIPQDKDNQPEILCVQGAYKQSYQKELIQRMQDAGYVVAPVVGERHHNWFNWNGGVITFVKKEHKLIDSKQMVFDFSGGVDQSFAKGVLYSKVKIQQANGKTIKHVFNFDLQSKNDIDLLEAKNIAYAQIAQMALFIERLNIPANEETEIVGNFGVLENDLKAKNLFDLLYNSSRSTESPDQKKFRILKAILIMELKNSALVKNGINDPAKENELYIKISEIPAKNYELFADLVKGELNRALGILQKTENGLQGNLKEMVDVHDKKSPYVSQFAKNLDIFSRIYDQVDADILMSRGDIEKKDYKEFVKHHNETNLKQFIYEKPNSEKRFFSYYQETKIPFLPYVKLRVEPINYVKKSVCLDIDKKHSIEFIKRGYGRFVDAKQEYEEEYTEKLVYHSSAENIQKLVDWGVVKPQTLSGRVLFELGKYRSEVHESAVYHRVISDKYEQKMELLDRFQYRVALLQELESFVNAKEPKNIDEFKEALSQYISKLKSLPQLLKDSNIENLFKNYDKNILESIIQNVNAELESASKLSKKIQKDIDCIAEADPSKQKIQREYFLNNYLSATGNDSILNFMQTQMIYQLREMQKLNQNLTYSGHNPSLDRGRLNSAIEEAMFTVERYQPDLHNRVTAEHHFDFTKKAYGQNIALELSEYCPNHESRQRALLAISFIEKKEEIVRKKESMQNGDSKTKYVLHHRPEMEIITELKRTTKETNLKEIKATKWAAVLGDDIEGNKALHAAKRIGVFFADVLINFGAAIPDIFWGIYRFSQNKPITSCAEKISDKLFDKHDHQAQAESFVHQLLQENKEIKKSVVSRIGGALSSGIQYIFQELWQGVYFITQEVLVHFPRRLVNDQREGYGRENIQQQWMQLLLDDVARIKKQDALSKYELENAIDKQNVAREAQNTAKQDHVPLKVNDNKTTSLPGLYYPAENKSIPAMPPYSLALGNPFKDILNSSARGIEEFMDIWMKDIYAKHPGAGLLFTAFYTLGGLSCIFPHLALALGKYGTFSQWLGQAMSQGAMSEGIAGGFLQAKIAAGIWEAVLHGPESWIAKGLSELEKHTVDGVIFFGVATALGYLVAYKLDIPWLSKEIADDAGNFPIAALSFAGAKLAVVFKEITDVSEWKKHEEYGSLRESLMKEYCRKNPGKQGKLDDNDNKEIDDACVKLISLMKNEVEELIGHKNLLTQLEKTTGISDSLNDSTKHGILSQLQTEEIKDLWFDLSDPTKQEILSQHIDNLSTKESEAIQKELFPKSALRKKIIALMRNDLENMKESPEDLSYRNLKHVVEELEKNSNNIGEFINNKFDENIILYYAWLAHNDVNYENHLDFEKYINAAHEKIIDNIKNKIANNESIISEKDYHRLILLTQLQDNREYLSRLSPIAKHAILQEAREYLTKKEAMAIEHDLLYPQKNRSILGETLVTALGYITAGLRVFPGCLITGSLAIPLQDLKFKVMRDATRIVTAATTLTLVITSFARRMFKTVGDVVMNEIIARIESLIRKDEHHAAGKNYEASADADHLNQIVVGIIQKPAEKMLGEVITPNPAEFVSRTTDRIVTHAENSYNLFNQSSSTQNKNSQNSATSESLTSQEQNRPRSASF